MKFPSLKYLATQAADAGTRFFLPLFISIMGAIIGMLQVDDATTTRSKLLFTCSIGLSLSLGCNLVAERSGKRGAQWLAAGVSLMGMLAYWFWLAPPTIDDSFVATITYLVLMVVVHLFVAIAPYIGHNQPLGFWRYNETLFMRLLIGGIFSGVLFAGLALAIAACEKLFNLHVNDRVYPKLWLAVVGGFNTWYFLAGIPRNYNGLDTETAFPKALKVFTQYILIPLVTLYMVILYAYGIRILVHWSLPRGWVSTLIMCYAAVGILAVLLVTPLRDDVASPWVRFFSRFFFMATLPLIVLLYVAIITRVNEYGITESRYYLLLIGAWLGFISLYFIFSRRKNIKAVPASLAILGLVSLWGPWSAFSISERSQVHRLKTILQKNKAWQPGMKMKAPAKLKNEDAVQVGSIIEYLVERDRPMVLQPLLATNIAPIIDSIMYDDTMPAKRYKWSQRKELEKALVPLFCTNIPASQSYNHDHWFEICEQQGLDVKGFSKAFDVSVHSFDDNETHLVAGADTLQFRLVDNDENISITLHSDNATVDSISLNALVKKLYAIHTDEWTVTMPVQDMTLNSSGPFQSRIIIKRLHLEDPNDHQSNRFREMTVMVLLR